MNAWFAEFGWLLGVAAGAAVALVAALFARRRQTLRLRRLAAAVQTIAGGDFAAPWPLPATDESGDELDRLGARIGRLSEHMVRQLAQLQQAEVQRRELIANVSHDLRTPLASMQGHLELLLMKQGSVPPAEQRSYLEIATRHCERLSKLVRDLFQLSKLEANEIAPHREAFSASELVQDVVQKLELAADKRGLRLVSRLGGEQIPVLADIGMIETVLENLIGNAMRHTARGGQVSVAVEPIPGRVRLRVSDTGCGIAQEDLARLFDRYYHVDRSEDADAGGTGLGLAIVRRIVELHGSTIDVRSQLGQGSSFAFDLPAIEVATPAAVA